MPNDKPGEQHVYGTWSDEDERAFMAKARADSKAASKKRKKKSKKKARAWTLEFIRLPWIWFERLQSTKRVSVWRLAMKLLAENFKLYESKGLKAGDIPLSNVLAQEVGISRQSKHRSLDELETLGLIVVKRQRGASPRVVLQHLSRGKRK
jgi:hypothetical protein